MLKDRFIVHPSRRRDKNVRANYRVAYWIFREWSSRIRFCIVFCSIAVRWRTVSHLWNGTRCRFSTSQYFTSLRKSRIVSWIKIRIRQRRRFFWQVRNSVPCAYVSGCTGYFCVIREHLARSNVSTMIYNLVRRKNI